ncbi:MAG: hypothetical protein QXQ43_02170 [Nitrososphaerota archaeon]
MRNLKEVILRLPEFRDYFDPKEPLTLEKCASFLCYKFITNSLINTQIDEGIDSLRFLMESKK